MQLHTCVDWDVCNYAHTVICTGLMVSQGGRASKKLKGGSRQPRGSLLHRVEGLDTMSGECKTCVCGRIFVTFSIVDDVGAIMSMLSHEGLFKLVSCDSHLLLCAYVVIMLTLVQVTSQKVAIPLTWSLVTCPMVATLAC